MKGNAHEDNIDLQIINCTRLEGKIRVKRTLGYVVEDFDR